MTNPLAPNVAVVAALLGRFPLDNEPQLHFARDQLSASITLAQTNTAAYGIPLDQHFPEGFGTETIAVYVNPVNVAGALLTLTNAAQRLGFNLTVDGSLQLWHDNAWSPVAGLGVPMVPVNIVAQQAAAPPAPAPVAIPPAPAAFVPPPAAPAPAGSDMSALVASVLQEPAAAAPDPAAALVAPTTVPANPIVATPAAPTGMAAGQLFPYPTAEQLQAVFPGGVTSAQELELYNAMRMGHIECKPRDQPLPPPAAAPAPVSAAQHAADADAAPAPVKDPDERLPDSSVLASRTGTSGRPQKSPFEGEVTMRKKVAAAPFWWPHLRASAKQVFLVNPAQALDPSSTGAGPVQAYAVLVSLLLSSLKGLDPHTTVAELRTFLRDVETGMLGTPSADAIFQLVELLFDETAAAAE